MLRATEIVFWTSLIIILYTYAGYPILLFIITSIKRTIYKKTIMAGADLPVTLIVTAYNEQHIIRSKIRNTLELNYPRNLLDIIFITDGSDDDTHLILAGYPEFKLLHQKERRGKLAAMDRAIKHAAHDIVVFSDANGFLNRDAIRQLVKHFRDARVGAVSGEKKILNTNSTVGEGEGSYWKYESFIKRLDSELYTVVGAAGELFSIRKKLYSFLPADVVIEDFVQSLQLCRQGFVVRYEPLAYSAEAASISIRDEMERKIRISAGGFQAMIMLKDLLNVFRHPILSFQYISHRVLRWTLCPLSLVFLFVSSWLIYLLTKHQLFGLFAVAQTCGYLAATVGGYLASRNQKHGLFYLPFYFIFMNLCVFIGFYRFLTRQQQAIWKKAARA